MNLCYRSENAFTMLEILASIAILSIVIIPLMGLFTTAPLLHAQREQQIRAAFLAQLRLEEVKQKITVYFDYNYDYGKSSGNGYDKSAGLTTDFPTPDFPASDAKFRYIIDDDLVVPDSGIKTIIVTAWYDADSDNTLDTGEQSIILKTKVARRKTVE